MKTQKNKQQIIKAIFIVLIIALLSPPANAQRRSGDSNKTGQHIEQNNNRPSKRTPSQKQDIDNTQKDENNKTAYRSKSKTYKNKHNNHQADYRKNSKAHYRNDRDKHHYHGKKQKQYHNGVHVHVNPPINRHWDVYHRQHISFRHLPRKAICVHLDGMNFYVYNGRFYRSGPLGYYRVKAPEYISILPQGCNAFYLKGYKVFNYRGVLFIDTPIGYKVVAS